MRFEQKVLKSAYNNNRRREGVIAIVRVIAIVIVIVIAIVSVIVIGRPIGLPTAIVSV